MFNMPKYSEEFHLELMTILDQLDPARISSDNKYGYFHIAGFAMTYRCKIVDAINKALTWLIDENHVLTEKDANTLNERISAFI